MNQLLLEHIVHALGAEPIATRQYADHAYKALKQVCPRALTVRANLAKNYLSSRANKFYADVDSDGMLNAFRIALCTAFEFQLAMHPELVPPAQLFPLKHQRPVIHEGAPHFAFQDALQTRLHRSLPRLHTLLPNEQALVLVMALAQRTGITQRSTLEALVRADTQYTVLTDARCICVEISYQNRVLLDGAALAMMRALPKRQTLKVLQRFPQAFKAWWGSHEHALDYSADSNLSAATILEALSFTTRSIAQSDFDDIYISLNQAGYIQAASGQIMPDEELTPAVRRRKHHIREFKKFEQIATLLASQTARQIAISPSVRSIDIQILDTIRIALNTFESSQPNQSRNSKAFTTLKNELLGVIEQGAKHDSMSHTAMLVALYCVDLTLHGSNTKKTLRISTITSYLSRLKSMALNAFADVPRLEGAQLDQNALIEQSEFVAGYISDLGSPSEQSTVINFLQYLHQVSTVQFFDAETLEYEGVCDVQVRTHYITPQMFESACRAFTQAIDSTERRQYVLFANLCYTLGLRRQEAQLLELEDIRFEANDIIITRFIKRKTQRAIRRARMCFLSTSDRIALEDYINERSFKGCTQVFDAHVLSALEKEFLETLRKQSNQDDLVLHSLRHSAANNMLFQLSMCCFERLKTARHRYYFLTHARFNNEQLRTITADIQSAGREANSYFSVLDTLAYLMGHVSPTVTAQSYLHLLDILFFELNEMRQKPLKTEAFLSLVAQNQYRFEHKTRYAKCLKDNTAAADQYAFKHFTRGLNANKLPMKISNGGKCNRPSPLTFNDFLRALNDYHQLPRTVQRDNSLHSYFDEYAANLNIEFYLAWSTRAYPTWLRLFERLTMIDYNTRNENALKTFAQLLTCNEVRTIRDLRRCLLAFELLGLFGLRFSVLSPPNERQSDAWLRMLHDHNHQAITTVEPVCTAISLTLKPLHLRYPPWSELPAVIAAFDCYQNYKKITLE